MNQGSVNHYRTLDASRVSARSPVLPLTLVGLRAAAKGRLAMALLFALPTVWMIIFSYYVYTKYALAEGGALAGETESFLTIAARMTAVSVKVRYQISEFLGLSRLFGLLVVTWYGAGLLCEDRRHGAHLLYFSRPLNRLQYASSRFLVAFAFGTMVTLVPGLFICATAAWSSPDWQFLREEPEVVWGTVVASLLIVGTYSLVALTISSVTRSRAVALTGTLAVFLVPHYASRACESLFGARSWRIASPFTDLGRISDALLGVQKESNTWPASWSALVLLGVAAVCILVLGWRLRRWELVA